MHVDGFRFDEGSILSRGEDGAPMVYPPVVWHIELSEELADTKIIAEAWDAAGLYQIGYFPGYRWAEWNGRYRDDVRRFVRGRRRHRRRGRLADRRQRRHLPGERAPADQQRQLRQLPRRLHARTTSSSYNDKHNEANGEGNRDGIDDNLSWNCGVEGRDRRPRRCCACASGR